MAFIDVINSDTPVHQWRCGEDSTNLSDTGSNGTVILDVIGSSTKTVGVSSLIASDTANTAISNNDSSGGGGWKNYGTNVAATLKSLECWLNPLDFTSIDYIITRNESDAGNEDGFALFTNGIGSDGSSGKVGAAWYVGGTRYEVTSTGYVINADSVSHIVATFDGDSTIHIYINGDSVATSATTTFTMAATNQINLLSRQNALQSLSATIDEINLYSQELTPARISAHYDESLSASTYDRLIVSYSPNGDRNDFYGCVGYEFQPLQNITVYGLIRGNRTPVTSSHLLKLWRVSDTTELASVDINDSSPLDRFGTPYELLATPLRLTANTLYRIASNESIGGDSWKTNLLLDPTYINTSIFDITKAVYSSSQSVYPASDASANQGYGIQNIMYLEGGSITPWHLLIKGT